MKAIKQIALGVIITLGIFSAVLYSSCAKNECGTITCLNHGSCMGGICKCAPGLGGANCEIVYRKKYQGTYKGLPPNSPNSDTTNMFFVIPTDEDTANYNTMDIVWVDTANVAVVRLPILLTDHTSSGSKFNIVQTTSASILYTGTGFINDNVMSVQLKRRYVGGGSDMIFFNNYIKE